MSDEQDSFMMNAFGVDLGRLAQGIKDEAAAAIGQAASTVTQVVQGAQGVVEGALDGLTGAVTGAAKKVVGAVSGSPNAGASGGATGSFPLGGSVGRGGKNAPNDVRAVQAALGIAADGQCGEQTMAAIANFQRNMGQAKPDGRVDAGGGTERALAGGRGAAPAPAPAAADGDGGLLGQLQQGAAGLINDVKILGGQVVTGAESLLEAASGTLSAAAGTLNADLGSFNPAGNRSKEPTIKLSTDKPVDGLAPTDQFRISYRVDDLGDLTGFSPTLILENSSPDFPTIALVESSGTGVIDAQNNTGFFIVEVRFTGAASAKMVMTTSAKVQIASSPISITVAEPKTPRNEGRSFIITPTFGVDGGFAAGAALLTFDLEENWDGGRKGDLQFAGVGASGGLKVNLSLAATSSNFETSESMTLESFAGSGTISSAGIGVASISSLLFQNGVKVSGLGFALAIGAGASLFSGFWTLTSHTGEPKRDPTKFA